MKRLLLETRNLVPTDCPRSLLGVLRFIPLFCAGKSVKAVIVVPVPMRKNHTGDADYLVCSGNHRSAAAHICKVPIMAEVIETDADLLKIRDGAVIQCTTVAELVSACTEAAEGGGYVKGRWLEYLKMITDSGVVGFDEIDTVNRSAAALRRGGRPII